MQVSDHADALLQDAPDADIIPGEHGSRKAHPGVYRDEGKNITRLHHRKRENLKKPVNRQQGNHFPLRKPVYGGCNPQGQRLTRFFPQQRDNREAAEAAADTEPRNPAPVNR